MPNAYGQRTGSDNLAEFLGLMKQKAAITQQGENEQKLQASGKAADLSNALAEQQNKAKLGSQEQQNNLDQLAALIGSNKGTGKKMSYKIGDVSASEAETNPYVQATRGESSAVSQAAKMYNSGLTDLNKKLSSAGEGLQTINDPTQIGSLGQARSLMLRSMGMNRYNEKEASASMPASAVSVLKGIFNQASYDPSTGADDDKNPMTPQQRQAAASFFRMSLDSVKNQHDQLFNRAQATYQLSPYANPNRDLSTLRKPFDQSLDAAIPKPPPAPPSSPTGKPLANPTPPIQSTDPWWKKLLPSTGGKNNQVKAVPAPGTSSQQSDAGLINVRHKQSGQEGTIDSNNAQDMQDLANGVYERVQ